MAFTEDQKLDIVAITGITLFDLDWHLKYYAANLSSTAEARVLAEIQTWDDNDLETDFAKLEPNGPNYGIRDNPEDLRDAIRMNIMLFLGIDPELANSGGGSSMRLERA